MLLRAIGLLQTIRDRCGGVE